MRTRLAARTIALAALVLLPIPAAGESPLVAELREFHTRYHEDPTRLDALREVPGAGPPCSGGEAPR